MYLNQLSIKKVIKLQIFSLINLMSNLENTSNPINQKYYMRIFYYKKVNKSQKNNYKNRKNKIMKSKEYAHLVHR